VKKLQAFNWRRVLVLPQGTAGKKENIWDAVTETPLNQEEMEELFENKVIRNLIYLIIVYRKKRSFQILTLEKLSMFPKRDLISNVS
jgi:hypothetical protein